MMLCMLCMLCFYDVVMLSMLWNYIGAKQAVCLSDYGVTIKNHAVTAAGKRKTGAAPSFGCRPRQSCSIKYFGVIMFFYLPRTIFLPFTT